MRHGTALSGLTIVGAALPSLILAASPPAAPLITEPSVNGQIVNPADVHMETGPFSDPDLGDSHLCTDWEIWLVNPPERVWLTACIGGVERLHTHLGDGVFEGSHAERLELLADTDYRLQVRHRDDSGDPLTEWSPWGQRTFRTGPPSGVFALELTDVADSPEPEWLDGAGEEIILPMSPIQPRLTLETAAGLLLLEIRGFDGSRNAIVNATALAGHHAVRVKIDTGGLTSDLLLPESRLAIWEAETMHEIWLPGVSLSPGETAWLWVSNNGSTFVGQAAETEPNFATLARGAPVPWSVLQPGYRVEVVATGLQLPINIAFKPNAGVGPNDPFYYVTELYGTIKVVTRAGAALDYAAGLLNFDPTGAFPGSGEQGLTGIAVDPATGDVFAAVLYDAGGPHYPKVVRFHSLDGGLTAATQTTILDMVGEIQGQSHQVSNTTIGPDGRLYVHMGDGFDSGTAQNLNSFRGKILRMNLNGTAPTDNPFYNAGDGITSRDYVYAYGFRNPFGGAWRAADGRHYEVENGPSIDRFARVVPGTNYLWNGSDASMTNLAIYNWIPSTAPVNIAFIESSRFGGSGFPAEKMGHAFVTESGSTWASGSGSLGKLISEFELSAAGQVLSGPTPLIRYNGIGKATASALAAGPDGLYFGDLYKDVNYLTPIDRGANILRVRFVGSAAFTADVTSGPAPLTVQFTDLSNVPNPTAWSWDFGDGSGSVQQNPTHTYIRNGSYNVTLRVTGTTGIGVSRKNAFIHVGPVTRIAIISDGLPPAPADDALAEHLRVMGFVVDAHDDDRANRPTAAQMASTYDLVIVSSTVASANIAGDFANQAVPLIHWEQALNRTDREPLASGGLTIGGVSSIDLLDNTHPVTANFPTGAIQVFHSPGTMSLATGLTGSGVRTLASRTGEPGDPAIMAAEAGASLLIGRSAPARRVFLFLENDGWLITTAAGKQLVDQAILWALGLSTAFAGADFDRDRDVDHEDLAHFEICATGPSNGGPEAGCEDADLNGDGSVDQIDFAVLQRCYSIAYQLARPDCAE